MGIKQLLTKTGAKVGDGISRAAALSPAQINEQVAKRDEYLLEMPKPDDHQARMTTERFLAAAGVEVFNAYLPQISELYVPLEKESFETEYNIRYFNITKWVTDNSEDSLAKLVNVYAVLSDEKCSIALVFRRMMKETQVFLAVTNLKNALTNDDADTFADRLKSAVLGNFPGTEFGENCGAGIPPFLNNDIEYSVAAASNIPAEKSEKFASQTIEKLLDGIVPTKRKEEYILILLASPIDDIEQRKLRLANIYSGLKPYAAWQTNFTVTELNTQGSSATVGINVGASAGIQNGANASVGTSRSDGTNSSETLTDSEGSGSSTMNSDTESNTTGETSTHTDSSGTSNTNSTSTSHTDSTNSSKSSGGSVGASGGIKIGSEKFGINAEVNGSKNWSSTEGTGSADMTGSGTARTLLKNTSDALAKNTAKTLANTVAKTTSQTVAHSVANTLGRTLTNTISGTAGVFRSINFGANFGMNFARSSNVSAAIGKNEGIVQSFENYHIRHALELLEEQMKRLEQSTALGTWDFAAYVLSEDRNTANNAAHMYLSLTQGDDSYLERSAINLWRGDMPREDVFARVICDHLREFRHPVFGLDPMITKRSNAFYVYPPEVTAATTLSGKELRLALNFPQKSVAGFPVIQCAGFGRSISTYDIIKEDQRYIHLGKIFHMLHEERAKVELSANSLASHTFITGSTGSGKSNTVYKMLDEAAENGIHYLVIEPAKGEYKHVIGKYSKVYGTNPAISPLLKIDPFSFPKEIHILEHLDGLIEIFNVCWPMYAAMPAVLKSAVERSYEDCGWDMTDSFNPYGDDLYPTFADVVRNIRTIIDSSEYDTENKGAYKGSLITRLSSLTNGINGMIFSSDEISMKDLFNEDVICDLSRVRSNETKALIMGLLVLKLQEYRMAEGKMNSELRHLTVLEEAHHLLRRTSTERSAESANLIGKSVEMLADSIAEMRTYGEGFIIVDQSPGMLDLSVIRNTNTKLIMRLPDEDDRLLAGRAAGLNDDQIKELARLPKGVAAVFQNEWVQPVLCKVEHIQSDSEFYVYDRPEKNEVEISSDDRVKIAEYLTKGTKLDKEFVLSEIRPLLKRLGVGAYVSVSIMKVLTSPPTEPRVTKLAPLMSAIFPSVYTAVENAYEQSANPIEWTDAAEKALSIALKANLRAVLRGNIVQAIITDYFMQQDKIDELNRWNIEGGLR